MNLKPLIVLLIFIYGCGKKVEKIKPTLEPISESIYASGTIKSKNQYTVYPIVNGIIDQVFVSEGDSVTVGKPLISIINETQQINRSNAELSANYNDFNANQGKLKEALLNTEVTKSKMKLDSALYARQKSLWQQQIGTKAELEQRELQFQNSKNTYLSALIKYNDLKRQLNFASSQSQKNYQIADRLAQDYIIKSQVNGKVYSLPRVKGDLVTAQTPLAVIGDSKQFVLEMQVDEYDILRIKMGMTVMVTLESYKGQVFEALITKINPIMNERSKTFLVEAEFKKQPELLYPNLSFEANIVIYSKASALLIPRTYLLNDSTVKKANGDIIPVKTGLKDLKKVEITSGLSINDELVSPVTKK